MVLRISSSHAKAGAGSFRQQEGPGGPGADQWENGVASPILGDLLLYVCIFIYIYIITYIYIYTYMYMYIFMFMYIYIYMYTLCI